MDGQDAKISVQSDSSTAPATNITAASERHAQAPAALMDHDLTLRKVALLKAERALEQCKVLAVIGRHMGYSKGRPIASLLAHRCCLQWRVFDSSSAPLLLDQLLSVLANQADGDAMSVNSQADLAYWLTVTSTLLAMAHKLRRVEVTAPTAPHNSGAQIVAVKVAQLQKQVASTFTALSSGFTSRLKAASSKGGLLSGLLQAPLPHLPHTNTAAAAAPTAPPATRTSLDGARAASKRTLLDVQQAPAPSHTDLTATAVVDGHSSSGVSGGSVSSPPAPPSPQSVCVCAAPVAAGPDPATLFLHGLDQLVQRTYGQLRDSLKKQLAALLPSCIQAPPHAVVEQFMLEADDSALGAEGGSAAAEAQLLLLRPWCELVGLLTQHLQVLKEACVPRILTKCLFKQIFWFIDSQLTNQLLLRPDCCSSSNARFVVAGLKRLDSWIMAGSEDYLRVLFRDLKHFRQASAFLVRPHKSQLGMEDLANMCPSLNVQQLYRLATTFHDDITASTHMLGGGGSEGKNLAVASAGTAVAARAVAGFLTRTWSRSTPRRSAGWRRMSTTQPTTSPPTDPLHRDCVSGEVLEEMKKQHNVTNNGGLIVTFLLDEELAPLIAQHGSIVGEVLKLIDAPELYQGFSVPEPLAGVDCPHEVFSFLEQDVPLPTEVAQTLAAMQAGHQN
ncbi:MAG: hypothetical protein WDW36_004858 [Sanguina aurantia]